MFFRLAKREKLQLWCSPIYIYWWAKETRVERRRSGDTARQRTRAKGRGGEFSIGIPSASVFVIDNEPRWCSFDGVIEWIAALMTCFLASFHLQLCSYTENNWMFQMWRYTKEKLASTEESREGRSLLSYTECQSDKIRSSGSGEREREIERDIEIDE